MLRPPYAAPPNIKLEIVPFEDTVPAFNEVLDHLGERIDVISCPYQTSYWGDRYQSFHLRDLPACVTCAKDPPREVMQFIMAVGQVNETE